jgi:ABC-2 type transport system permease protein
VFLSGYVFPIEEMPAVVQFICRLIPATYAFQIIRGIVPRGTSFADLCRSGRSEYL